MKKQLVIVGIFVVAINLVACSSAPHQVESENMAPDWRGVPYNNLLVTGIYEDRAYRISSEITFSDELKSKGIKASPGYETLPQLNSLDDSAEVSRLLASQGFDALLTVATTQLNDEYTYRDALQTRGWVYLLGGRPGAGTSTGILISSLASGTYALHIALWDAKTQKPVWQATTHSVFQDTTEDEIKTLAELVIQKLRGKGLI